MARTALLEIGCEELPASFIDAAREAMARVAREQLAAARVHHGALHAYGTPRRLALLVHDVAGEVPARTDEVLGPPESAARKDGAWTRAAEGFARKNGVPLDALSVVDVAGKGRYLRALVEQPAARSTDKLPAILDAVVRGITFPKSMRWADIETPFGRPVQWLVAMYGDDVLPLEFVRHTAGRATYGHRFLAPEPIDLPNADAYIARLRAAHVLADPAERLAVQHRVLEAAAQAERGEWVRNEVLEREVLGLVEEPFAVLGRFDPKFLALPEELIETVMSHHQRYFAVRAKHGGALLPVFLTTVNTALDPDTIRKGNERVMRARLADAEFFVAQDRKSTLASRVPRLDGVVYHQKLGTYGDKVRRLVALAPLVAEAFNADQVHAARAAELCKADLVALAVGEFPELQGVMGRDYARHDGEPAAVATAIGEHYRPVGATDTPAESHVGAALAVADRLDSLVGFFAIGQRPSSGGDPFGLRRAALGVLRTVIHHRVRLSLATFAGRAYALYARELARTADETGRDVVDFVRERLENVMTRDMGLPLDVVKACLDAGHDDPVDALERVEAVASVRGTPTFPRVVTAFERVFNIWKQAEERKLEVPEGVPDPQLLTKPAEVALREAFGSVREQLRELLDERRFVPALELIGATLPAPIDRFFTEVMVMDSDVQLRNARLQLMRQMAEEVGVIARFDTLAASAREMERAATTA